MANQIKTKKNQQIVGKVNYLNPTTNTLEKFSIMQQSEETDFNFHKVWIKDLVALLDLIGGQKVKVFNHILSVMNADNIYIGSIREMAKTLELSVQTVSSSLKLLKSSGQLKMLQNGVYMINPSLMLKGKSLKRQKLNATYNGSSFKKIVEPKTRESKEERDFNDLSRAVEDKNLSSLRTQKFIEEMQNM